MSQKEAAWEVMEAAYMAASGNDTLPAMARQIYYQARPKIMELTDDKQLDYGYFSQVLLPDYIEEHGVNWNVVYDARGHFEEPHTNRSIGCGTIEVGNYLDAMKDPEVIAAEFAEANVNIIGPSGGISAVSVLRKGRLQPAVQGGEPRQPLRPDDHLDEGRVRHRRAAAGRRRLWRQQHSAIRTARLRRRRVHDPWNAAARHSTLPVLKHLRGRRSGPPPRRHRRPRAGARRGDQDQRGRPAQPIG